MGVHEAVYNEGERLESQTPSLENPFVGPEPKARLMLAELCRLKLQAWRIPLWEMKFLLP